MKILVKITNGKKTYIEDVTETVEHMDENETGPVKCNLKNIPDFNHRDNYHFIYGWVEGFLQSDEVPDWMNYGYRDLKIEVINE